MKLIDTIRATNQILEQKTYYYHLSDLPKLVGLRVTDIQIDGRELQTALRVHGLEKIFPYLIQLFKVLRP